MSLLDWLKAQAARFERTARPKNEAAITAAPSEPAKKLLGATAHGLRDIEAEVILGSGDNPAPAVASTFSIGSKSNIGEEMRPEAPKAPQYASLRTPPSNVVPKTYKPVTNRIHDDDGLSARATGQDSPPRGR